MESHHSTHFTSGVPAMLLATKSEDLKANYRFRRCVKFTAASSPF